MEVLCSSLFLSKQERMMALTENRYSGSVVASKTWNASSIEILSARRYDKRWSSDILLPITLILLQYCIPVIDLSFDAFELYCIDSSSNLLLSLPPTHLSVEVQPAVLGMLICWYSFRDVKIRERAYWWLVGKLGGWRSGTSPKLNTLSRKFRRKVHRQREMLEKSITQ